MTAQLHDDKIRHGVRMQMDSDVPRTSKGAILFPCLPPLAVLVDDIQNLTPGKGNLIRVVR